MIDKDQIPIIHQMIKEIYTPVILRAIVNLVLIDISQILQGSNIKSRSEGKRVLMDDRCQKVLLEVLDTVHKPRSADMIDEILRQFGLALRKDEQDFYHQHMGVVFDKQVDYVKQLLQGYKYDHLYNLSKVTVN